MGEREDSPPLRLSAPAPVACRSPRARPHPGPSPRSRGTPTTRVALRAGRCLVRASSSGSNTTTRHLAAITAASTCPASPSGSRPAAQAARWPAARPRLPSCRTLAFSTRAPASCARRGRAAPRRRRLGEPIGPRASMAAARWPLLLAAHAPFGVSPPPPLHSPPARAPSRGRVSPTRRPPARPQVQIALRLPVSRAAARHFNPLRGQGVAADAGDAGHG